MNLFVRSQDRKTLMSVSSLTTRPISGRNVIVSDTVTLGEYESKKRCLEILDEIQNILAADPVPLLVFTNCDIIETEELYKGLNEMYKNGDLLALGTSSQENVKVFEKSTAVYQMPEK